MAEGPAYLILGRGRWAARMRQIIANEGRSVSTFEETRQAPSENDSAYVSRLAAAMGTSRPQIAWLCVAPGPHVPLMIHAAVEAGLHVVVEKPWYGSSEVTRQLQTLAHAKKRLIAVHFEYLVLEEVERWKREFHPGAGLQLGGRFFLGRSDQTGIPAMDNVGCHLLAIHEYAMPSSEISEIRCGYDLPDERVVWTERGGQRLSSIDLFSHRQPIIQRFIKRIEAALDGAAFPFDLHFALRVANQLNAYKVRGPA
jgi:hypothetical protein